MTIGSCKFTDVPTDAVAQGVSSAGATARACGGSGVVSGSRQASFLTLLSAQRVFPVTITSLTASFVIPRHDT